MLKGVSLWGMHNASLDLPKLSGRKTHSNLQEEEKDFVYVTKSPELGCLQMSSDPDTVSETPAPLSPSLSPSPLFSLSMSTCLLLTVLYYSVVVSFLIMLYFKFLISQDSHVW